MPWTRLEPSAQERRWRIGGLVAAIAVGALLTYAGIARDPRRPAVVWLAVAVTAMTAGVAANGFRRAVPREISVDADGTVRLRVVQGPSMVDPASRLQVRFAAPWLITLSQGTMSVAIWPDSLPPDAYRRLWVCVRWGRQRPVQPTTPNNENVESRPTV